MIRPHRVSIETGRVPSIRDSTSRLTPHRPPRYTHREVCQQKPGSDMQISWPWLLVTLSPGRHPSTAHWFKLTCIHLYYWKGQRMGVEIGGRIASQVGGGWPSCMAFLSPRKPRPSGSLARGGCVVHVIVMRCATVYGVATGPWE